MWIWRIMEHMNWTDRIRNEAVLERVDEERMMLKLIRKRKRLGHWLRRNCLLKDALEGMVNGSSVQGRRKYQMLDDSKIYGSYETKRKAANSLLSKNLKVRIYKTVILPVVLYGCETWTLTLREEQRLRVFENKVLRKIFGAKRDEVTGEWRKLHNAELHALYPSPDIIRNIKSRRLRSAGHVARMGESRNAYRVLVGRPEGKRPLGRPMGR
ncbi:hypothetical protein ANN_23338 [Periplaneta americana]|uniref:Reverse transcriptase domain-containing protein n=1 Tax=Periplaneta americana TaxID=6978 RepID=A0ABQ8SM97_PERAM|nr:hypothetical protein ANN_23338 [Periplaneta americana]